MRQTTHNKKQTMRSAAAFWSAAAAVCACAFCNMTGLILDTTPVVSFLIILILSVVLVSAAVLGLIRLLGLSVLLPVPVCWFKGVLP